MAIGAGSPLHRSERFNGGSSGGCDLKSADLCWQASALVEGRGRYATGMLYCGFRVPILSHLVHQQLKRSQRDLAGGILAEDGKHVLVEQVLHILSHFLAPGARLYGRVRLPKLGKALDGCALADILCCVLLDRTG